MVFFPASGILRPRGTNNNSIRKPKKVLKMYHAIEIILYAHLNGSFSTIL